MKRSMFSQLVPSLAPTLLLLATSSSLVPAQEKAAVPTGDSVNVTVAAAGAPPPPVSITLHDRHGHVTPNNAKCTHSGGGLIEVTSPAPDIVLISMTGAVIANAAMKFDLEQCFEVSFDDPKIKKAKLAIEGRVIGLLRGENNGCAEYSDACAHLSAGPIPLLSICMPPHNVCNCASLAVNDHVGPKTVSVLPGKYTWQQTFTIAAHTDTLICKRPSAEFAPDPALDPLWISYHEPFHGVKKDSFGLQVILKLVPDTDQGDGSKKGTENLPPPTEEKDPVPANPQP